MKNEIERINKQTELIKGVLNEFLDVMGGNINSPSYFLGIEALKDKLNQPIEPTQPEGYQGLNKWYKSKFGGIIYATDKELLKECETKQIVITLLEKGQINIQKEGVNEMELIAILDIAKNMAINFEYRVSK